MGVEGGCRSGNRGGSLFYATSSLYPGANIHHPPSYPRASSGRTPQKRGKSYIFFGVLWCFLGILGDRKRQKAKIYLEGSAVCEGKWCAACLPGCLPFACHWCRLAGCRGFRWSFVVCSVPFPCLCPLSCFAFGGLLANMALFGVLRAFLAWFGVRMYICMG